jgi:pimeloyl-ACP methyl ester carboxylesterase
MDFLLIPGAWLGSWVWEDVADILMERGHRVFAVTLTGMGDRVHLARPDLTLEDAVIDVQNILKYDGLRKPIIVGHSFAGSLAAKVADLNYGSISGLIFLDSSIPQYTEEKQCGIDQWNEQDRIEFLDDVNKKWGGFFVLTDEMFSKIGFDFSSEQRKAFFSRITPLPFRYIADSIQLSSFYPQIRKAHILCTGGGDNPEEMIKYGLFGPYKIIESGHWPMITKPEETALNLISLARTFETH